MTDRKFDLLVAGEINPDLILSGNVIPEFDQVEKIVDQAVFPSGHRQRFSRAAPPGWD